MTRCRQGEDLVQLLPREGFGFGGALQFNDLTPVGQNHIKIYLGLKIFLVAQIQQTGIANDAHANSRHGAPQRQAR